MVGACWRWPVCAALGVLIDLLVLRPLRRSSALARVTANAGHHGGAARPSATLVFGYNPLQLPSLLPLWNVHIVSQRLPPVGVNYVIMFGIGVVLTAGLLAGLPVHELRAGDDGGGGEPRVAASLAHSPDLVASVNWAVGSVLAGFAGVLIRADGIAASRPRWSCWSRAGRSRRRC